MDYTQNNPVQHVFCQLLLEGMEKRRRDSGIDDVIATGCCVVPPVPHKMEDVAGKCEYICTYMVEHTHTHN